MSAQMVPMFPLGAVLFPGAPLSLHIFEDRYRVLMADLLALPEAQRRFGVVAIRQGREVGVDGVNALYDVGCMATTTETQQAPDGTYAIECVGTERFRVISLDSERPYLRATVEWLPEPTGEVGGLAEVVTRRYDDYRSALGGLRGVTFEPLQAPSDPRLLSYLVAATVVADNIDRQQFLAEYDAAGRLAAQARWLALETRLLREFRAVPAGRLLDSPSSVN